MPPQRKRKAPARFSDNAGQNRPRRPPHQPPVESPSLLGDPSDTPLQASVQRQMMRDIMSEMVPTVTKAVVDTLIEMKVVDPMSHASPSDPAIPLQENLNGAMYPDQRPQEHPVTATRPGNDPFSHSPPSFLLGIDSKLKGRIWANEYIDLASLLAEETESNDSFRLVESTNGTVALQKMPQHKSIISLNQWNTAFHKYISILTESQPLLIPSLMQYMEHIRRLAQRAGDQAAFYYDRTFRKLRQCDPSLSFAELHASTYTEAICMGLSNRLSTRPFRSTKQTTASSKPCFNYNNKGTCSRQQCNYQHACQKCFGPHPKKVCPLPKTDTPSNPSHSIKTVISKK